MANHTPSLQPLTNVSRFEAPAYQSHPRSPSASPTRPGRFVTEELDPLLANLSPDSTLQALRVSDVASLPANSKDKSLTASIADASESERALGIRAAIASKKLREWVREVQDWHWPIEEFAPLESSRTDQDSNGDTEYTLRESEAAKNGPREVYFGSLPAGVVRGREIRIESIMDDMDTLEVEELKGYVRGAHSNSSSRSASYDFSLGQVQPTQYTHLDDFTVVITATIVQTLPFLARLEKLLGRWSLRLFVLRQVPGFLQQLEDTQVALESAWTTLSQAAEENTNLELTRSTYATIKAILQDRVSELARKIDAILDALEGSEDRIPDRWIDDMEAAEEDFQNWMVEAERLLELSDLRGRKVPASDASVVGEEDLRENSQEQSADALEDQKEDPSLSAEAVQDASVPLQGKIVEGGQGSHDKNEKSLSLGNSSPNQATGLDEQGKSLSEKRTPPRGLFFMRNTPPKSGGAVEPTSPSNYEDLSKQAKLATAKVLEDDSYQKIPSDSGIEDDEWLLIDEKDVENNFKASGPQHSARKPPPLDLDPREVEPAPSSDLSHTASESSDAFSNMSSPQIMDASSVQFFKTPMDDKIPLWVTQDDSNPSKNPSQPAEQTPLGHRRSVSAADPLTRSRASSYVSDITINGRDIKIGPASQQDVADSKVSTGSELRRASATSIEAIPRTELRSIAIRRNSSQKSRTRSLSGSMSVEDAIAQQIAENQHELETNKSDDESPGIQGSPSLRVKKVRDKQVSNFSSNDDRAAQMENPKEVGGIELKQPEDKLSAKINSILSRIPAPIKLATTPAPKTVDAGVNQKQVASKADGASANRTQRFTSSAPLTLVPANTKTPSQQNDNEGKLYHLHQPGRDIPIKLFIRLVGSEERVMVRVGGGWADLAEYLKEYAIHHQHHGRRAVSDKKFEIKSLPSSSSIPTVNTTENGRSPSGSVSGDTPGSIARTPGQRLSSGPMQLSTETPSEELESTPISDLSEPSSIDPPSTSSWREQESSLGLAGPKSKKIEISPQKKAWVDGMLSQARHISFEHKKADTAEGGDSGKGIKRVFLKNKADD